MDIQGFRHQRLFELTDSAGVYALCDLDQIPIYVGQSKDGIRSRVRRHLTSAPSDVIANRQIDVWEVAYVWAWPLDNEPMLDVVESTLFHQFDGQSRLMNGTVPPKPERKIQLPEMASLQVLPDEEISLRRQPRQRFPRQAQQVSLLLDYILETFDKPHLRRSLHAHFERLERYYRNFQGDMLAQFQKGE